MIRAAALALVVSLPVHAADFTAKPSRVVDGDTLTINFRSQGIDAPELHQQCADAAGVCYPCGMASRDALKAITGSGKVSVRVWESDRYGRPVVTIYADGKDVHREMLLQGHAVAYRRYLPDELRASYLAAEAKAKEVKRGIWAGAFVEPSKWRRGEQLACEK